LVTKDEPKDKAIASNPRDVTTAVASRLLIFEQARQKFWQFQEAVYDRIIDVTTQADSQKQIKQNIFYEIKHMSLNFK
jgi:hypothetical protein